jgi:hypothetical protein
MSDPTPKPMAFWKAVVVGLAGAAIGFVLANGFNLQALPFQDWGIAPKWVPLVFAVFLASFVGWVVDLHGAICGGFKKAFGKLRGLDQTIALWLAPHLAAAAARIAKEGAAAAAEIAKQDAPESHEVTGSQTVSHIAPPAPPPPEAAKHA